MFPFALINSIGVSVENKFKRFAKKINEPLLKTFLVYLKLDSAMILDSKNPLELLQELKKRYGDFIDLDKLKQEILNNYISLDAWAVAQINKDLEKQREALRNKNISEEEIDKRVPLIPKKDSARMEKIPLASRNSMLLQNEAYKKHFNDVEDLITDRILSKTEKLTAKEIDDVAKEILDKTNMNAARARFWVEDQARIVYSEQFRIAALRSGQTHYRWKSRGDARSSHAIHNGQIYSWKEGVNNLSRPGARHAGEDYRCHCEPEIVSPEQIAKAGVSSPNSRGPQSTPELVANYEGIEGLKAAKGISDSWAKKNLMNNYSPAEIDGLNAWQSGYYASIDSYLEDERVARTPGQIITLESRISAIDEAIAKSVLPVDLTVRSGVDAVKSGIVFEDIKIGQTILKESFMPTTTSENIAKTFTDSAKVIYEISLPKGSKGVYMNNVTKLKPHEKEILLGRNQRFKVIDKYKKNGYNYIKMEIEK